MANAPKMTKAHYEFIAETLRATRPAVSLTRDAAASLRWEMVVDAFAFRLCQARPDFDAARFVAACKR